MHLWWSECHAGIPFPGSGVQGVWAGEGMYGVELVQGCGPRGQEGPGWGRGVALELGERQGW